MHELALPAARWTDSWRSLDGVRVASSRYDMPSGSECDFLFLRRASRGLRGHLGHAASSDERSVFSDSNDISAAIVDARGIGVDLCTSISLCSG